MDKQYRFTELRGGVKVHPRREFIRTDSWCLTRGAQEGEVTLNLSHDISIGGELLTIPSSPTRATPPCGNSGPSLSCAGTALGDANGGARLTRTLRIRLG
jgi:hypothetical protein